MQQQPQSAVSIASILEQLQVTLSETSLLWTKHIKCFLFYVYYKSEFTPDFWVSKEPLHNFCFGCPHNNPLYASLYNITKISKHWLTKYSFWWYFNTATQDLMQRALKQPVLENYSLSRHYKSKLFVKNEIHILGANQDYFNLLKLLTLTFFYLHAIKEIEIPKASYM